jgi:chemotaxis regulatin CheY-phosphate phosphatase CheZ
MEKEFKELQEKSKKAINEIEKKIEEFSGDLPKEIGEFWDDLKVSFTKIKDELLDDEHKEKAQEKVLEAKEKLSHIKESTLEFANKFKDEHQAELDIAALRAHLAKMEAEDFIEESRKKISREVQESSHSLEKLALDASKELSEFFHEISEKIGKKS